MTAIKKHTASWMVANPSSLPLLLFTSTIIATILLSTTTIAFTSNSRSSSRHPTNNQHNNSNNKAAVTTTTLHSSSNNNDDNNNALNNEMQTLGNEVILSAAKYHGATDEMVSIDWKSDRIIVTVDVGSGLDDDDIEGSSGSDVVMFDDLLEDEMEYTHDYDDPEFDEEYDYEDDEFNDEDDNFEALQEQLGLQPESTTSSNRIDLTLIARTINEYLSEDGEDSPKFRIAQLHEIEVTTPEFDNVLRADNGVDMFEVYKGFDVIVDYWEVPKKKKKKKKGGKAGKEVVETVAKVVEEEEEEEEPKRTQKVIEGKLVGRDEEKDVTMINVKGRIMKIKNDMIESVMLPKAKREKGVK